MNDPAAEYRAAAETASEEQLSKVLAEWHVRQAEMARELAQVSFIDFINQVAPWFIVEEVHVLIAEAIEELIDGPNDRLMVFMPPRTGKSLMVSVFLPAWFFGKFPDKKVMQASYKVELARGFGGQVRDLIEDEDYQRIFPGVKLLKHTTAKDRFLIQPRDGGAKHFPGEYTATGIRGGIAGKGWHLGIIDDPLSEQDAVSQVAKDFVWDAWYGPGFYTRRQPEGRNKIIVMSTRWAEDDLPGRLLQAQKDGATHPYTDKWKVVSVPAILSLTDAGLLNRLAKDGRVLTKTHPTPYVFKRGESFAPRRWKKEELLKAQAVLTETKWSAIYQQNPVPDDGNILKRKKWRRWKDPERPPECVYVMQVYDTAFEEGEENDYTARTTWGIFEHTDTGDPLDTKHHCILLERMCERLSFPDLRDEAFTSYELYKPDKVVIEKRGSGHSLLQEMRRKKVPVSAFDPKSKSKTVRAHVASICLDLGSVWYMPRDWADEVINQCAQFPFGEHDDMVDTCVMAWLYLRRMFWLGLSDEDDSQDHAGYLTAMRGSSVRSYGGKDARR